MSIKNTINTWRKFAPKPSAFIKNLFLRSAQYCAKNGSICGAIMFLDVWQKLVQFSKTGYHWYQRFFSRARRYVSGQKEKLACVERGRGLGGRGKGRGIGERRLLRFSPSPPPLPFLRPPRKIAGQTNSLKVTRPSFFFGGGGGRGYHPTLKLSGFPTFNYNIKFLAIGVNVTWL